MPAPWMAGVCAGLAVHLGVSVALVRIIMICMTFVGSALAFTCGCG